VARLNELDLTISAIERAKHAVDAVAGIAKHFARTPRVEARNEKIANSLCHGKPSRERGGRVAADEIRFVIC
jgi:hypothetical protein